MVDPSPWVPRGGAVALLLTLGACSSDAGGPSDQAGAEGRTGCTTIVIHSPVTLTEANTFATHGELHGSGAVIGKLPSVAVSGTLSGARLSLVAPSVAEGPAISYQLEAGATRSGEDVTECPL